MILPNEPAKIPVWGVALVVALVVLLEIALVNSAFGYSWTNEGETGTWETATGTEFSSGSGNLEGRVNFTAGAVGGINDGEGIHLAFTVNMNATRENWYDWAGVKRFYFSLELVSGANHVNSLFYIAKEATLLYNTKEVRWGTTQQIVSKVAWETTNNTDNFAIPFLLSIVRNGTNAAIIYVSSLNDTLYSNLAQFHDWNGLVWNETTVYSEELTVPAGFWTNPTLNFYVGHEGSGAVVVSFDFEEIGTVLYPQPGEYVNDEPAVSVWDRISGAWSTVVSWFGIFGSLAATIVSIAGILVANAPIILLIFGVGALIACVSTMSLDPVFKIFEFFYNLSTAAVSAFTGIISTIKDLIQWW